MAKLVILTQGMAGRAHELNVERTTIGRVEDNTFQITDPSVSSHHCEVLLRGSDILVRDLNSTNGSFINDAQITESALKPGQKLRLGQIELRLEAEGAPSAPAPAPVPATSAPPRPPAPAPAPMPSAAPAKKTDSTMVMPRGVSLSDLEGGGRRPLDAAGSAFTKKRNKSGIYFWIGAAIGVLVIAVLIIFVLKLASGGNH